MQETTQESFKNVDLILASAGSSISRKWKDAIKSSGALMIDNSSAFRMDKNVPLVVQEVNPFDASKLTMTARFSIKKTSTSSCKLFRI